MKYYVQVIIYNYNGTSYFKPFGTTVLRSTNFEGKIGYVPSLLQSKDLLVRGKIGWVWGFVNEQGRAAMDAQIDE